MTTFVVDVETTIRGGKEHGSSPYHSANELVAVGFYDVDCRNYHEDYRTFLATSTWLDIKIPRTLVGHNIGFDLKWLLSRGHLKLADVLENVTIWDTQQVEYLLSGQSHLFPSLDDCCKDIGLPLKDDKIKEYWKAGVDTFDIPKEELMAYLKQDVMNTYQLWQFQKMVVEGMPKEFQELVKVKMDDLLYTTLMEHNGMEFDLGTAAGLADLEQAHISMVEEDFNQRVQKAFHACGAPAELTVSISSNQQLGAFLFGGELEYTGIECIGMYKTGARKGEPKMKKTTYTHKWTGLWPGSGTPTKTGWKTDDEALSNLVKFHGCEFSERVLAWRKSNKELSTYLKGYSAMVSGDGRIHASINHCSTATGRQSCTKPNLQNVSGVED